MEAHHLVPVMYQQEIWDKFGINVDCVENNRQGISVINHKKNAGEIKRNSLVIESVEIVRRIKPRVFIFENVQAFWKTLCVTKDEEILPIGMLIQRELGADYVISSRVLNFMNYGSNSSRTRTLVIGVDKEYRNQLVPYDLIPAFRKTVDLLDSFFIPSQRQKPREYARRMSSKIG